MPLMTTAIIIWGYIYNIFLYKEKLFFIDLHNENL